MTNQQAINLLKGLEQSLNDYCELNDEWKAAFCMAVTALELFGNSEQLPPAQSEERTEKRTKTRACDLISRQYLVEHVKACMENDRLMKTADKDEILQMIADVPSAQQERCEDCENFSKTRLLIPQPERKAGRWIYGEHDTAMCDGYRCDKCGFFVPWDYKFTFIDFINDYHFCPSCGSEMRGDDGEID